MHRWVESPWKLPVVSGAVLGVGYFVELLVPLLLALTPVLYWMDRHLEASPWVRFRSGLYFGFVAAMIGLNLCYGMLDYSWLAAVLWVWFAFLLAIKLSLCFLVASWLRRKTGLS